MAVRKLVLPAALVVAVALAGCSSASTRSRDSSATTAVAPHIPASPLGAQIQFALDLANGKVGSSEYSAHFAAAFLAAVPPAKLDEVTAQQLQPAAPWALDHFIEGPSADSAVLIVKSAQGSKLTMTIKIDGTNAHLITGLLYQPYAAE